jgi:hypothetical protein
LPKTSKTLQEISPDEVHKSRQAHYTEKKWGEAVFFKNHNYKKFNWNYKVQRTEKL